MSLPINSLIHGVCRLGQRKEATRLLNEMVTKKIYPDVHTFTVLVDTLCKEGMAVEAKGVIEMMIQRDLELKYDHLFVVDPVNAGGGLALFWDKSVHVAVTSSSFHYVRTVVTFVQEAVSCNITWMYGTPHVNCEKTSFWRAVYSLVVFR
ncbi:putative pentatricopeptide [Rosa chinensis]|uniref:Putative pentatricopeptide n=1 Tax=Rosa chinensis TaxID=74649 RepID=A0A2P6RVM1_ROSCH|nr:putative pentatricopeptide [Rosa chinensis]